MTEQEKQEIIAEIRKSVMEEMKQNAERKDAGVVLENSRRKWLEIRFLRTTENWQSKLIETTQRMCGIASEN